MSRTDPPFKLDLRGVIADARRKLSARVGPVSISLPFVSFNVDAQDVEKKVAAEVVVRLADRRVLNAFECCDDCIERALASLQEIRTFLVAKQVDLARVADGPLFILVAAMLEGIRQFSTFQERLSVQGSGPALWDATGRPAHGVYEPRQLYFSALEMLRAHLHRCLFQVAKVAEVEIPKITLHMRYPEPWQLEAYEPVGELSEGV